MDLDITGGGRPPNGQVKSAARALDLLDDIAAHGPGTQLLLATRMGIPKSSLHALLHTMTARGWLETDQTGSVYRLGIHSLMLGSAYLDGDSVVARASVAMDEISSATGEAVHLGRLDGRHVVYTAKRESTHPLRMHSGVGRRLPACSTALGRAILAEQSLTLREQLVPDDITSLTPRTTTDRRRVLEIVGTAAVLGYAVESEESCMGVRCFAIALPFGRAGTDALSVAAPMSRLDGPREDFIVDTLLRIKAELASGHEHDALR